jgi:hypothetical protein
MTQPRVYPLIEQFPVVRIPIAGPEPYNTLAVVRARLGSQTAVANGKIFREKVTFATSFTLIGHDPRIKPAFEHSTMADIWLIAQDDDAEFLYAVDTVTGAFGDDGNWQITADVVAAVDGENSVLGLIASSWILCHEPPVDPQNNPGSPTQQGLRMRSIDAQTVRTTTLANILTPLGRTGVHRHGGVDPTSALPGAVHFPSAVRVDVPHEPKGPCGTDNRAEDTGNEENDGTD